MISFYAICTLVFYRVITVVENVRTVQNQTPLLAAIGCGILWQQWLDEGLFANVSELAKHLGKERSFVSHMLHIKHDKWTCIYRQIRTLRFDEKRCF